MRTLVSSNDIFCENTYNDATQGGLSIRCNSIRFIQNNNFKGWIGICVVIALCVLIRRSKEGFHGGFGVFLPHTERGEMLDFIAYYGNTAFIRGVQFQDASFPLRGMPQLTTERQSHGCLPKNNPMNQRIREQKNDTTRSMKRTFPDPGGP